MNALAEHPSLPARVLSGDRAALSRLISWAENGDARFAAALAELYAKVGRAWRTGITGPPGAGKSTLVNALCGELRRADKQVAVLAVDPSSPFSGGALLGDRIRMEERTADPRVYIRSMASRGSHGGLSRAAVDACDVMDAFGFDEIVVETVGVGQAEFDVMGAVDTVVVALCPGAGDGIQAMKAGLLEVADVLVVNKSDLPDADRLALDLEEAVHVRFGAAAARGGWQVPIVRLVARDGSGVDELVRAIARHRAHLESRGLAEQRNARRLAQVRRVALERLDEALWSDASGLAWRAQASQALAEGATPYDVAHRIAAGLLRGAQEVRFR